MPPTIPKMDENSSTPQPEAGQEQSPAITIRQPELSDVDDMMVWLTDDRVSQYTVRDTFTSKEQVLDYINNVAIPHPWFKVICIDNTAIGSISITPHSGCYKCKAELSYVLGHDFWGKRIMTEAVKMVVSTIFEEFPDLERLEAFADVKNMASHRVLEKSGFQKEGVLRKYIFLKGCARDVAIFSLLSTDVSHE